MDVFVWGEVGRPEMEPDMNLRVFLYRPGDTLLKSLPQYIESLGHDVAVIDYPHSCLQYHTPENRCSNLQVCADAIIIGHGISPSEGLRLIEKRLASGCLGAVNNSIINDTLSEVDRRRAKTIGCHCIEGQLELSAIGDWLKEVEQKIDQARKLSGFTIGSTIA
jgi:hypothetical protein